MTPDEQRPWLAGYFREPVLRPVLIVLLAHGVLALAIAMLDTVRRQGTLGILVLTGTAAATAWALRRDWMRRRVGLASPTLLGLWAVGALTAWAADHFQLY
jgi:hypothetical protein